MYGAQKGVLQQDVPWFEERLLHMFCTLIVTILQSTFTLFLPISSQLVARMHAESDARLQQVWSKRIAYCGTKTANRLLEQGQRGAWDLR